ncbi:alpha/beta hydrolase [Kitasatospora sp. NPDC059648]|uniref:alpha/beta hydrolase n=1 Tax=Kitasatospora sp. NPDC059648 TaxID=3346894 RepID=UPI0036B19372
MHPAPATDERAARAPTPPFHRHPPHRGRHGRGPAAGRSHPGCGLGRRGPAGSNTGDPAWPYEGSRALADTLARGRLLTVGGDGHTVLGNPSGCASGHEERYLVDGELPARGRVCAPDRRSFQ